MEPSWERARVAGAEIRMWRAGEGPALLFLHGAGGPAWAPGMELLARRYTVLFPEHPGFGESGRPGWVETVHDLGIFYLEFLEALQLREVALVGHSLGGWIASEVASLCTHSLRALVLVAPVGINLGAAQVDIFATPPDELAPLAYYDKSLATARPPLGREELRVLYRNRATSARLSWASAPTVPKLAARLFRIRIPTLLLWGQQDELIPASSAGMFLERIPQARLVTLEACGHVPQVEQPEAFARHVTEFLDAVVGVGGSR
ncbi:MAG: alpha/beta fold hydrolase [Armatimonadota bacterium]|nr:alpha/beta fold hydrolase [Armatimonadota bacterium]MDR7445051.1 alpha/beta fold hydrolase [Armatimonadota bacterium]MDR7569836.1 alpha/beta fold hydrolase [Armatimonadota bacterium]MDR7614137.1 alpha/beta fold hydrolase [Armatimonadota bacterium]